MPLIQRIYKGQPYPNSVQKGPKGWMCLYLKTPKRLHTVYTNKSAWKIEGLAQSVLSMVVTTFLDREACLNSILVYVQIQIKVEDNEFSLPPPSNKNKSLSDIDGVTGRKGQSQCKCSSLRSRMGLGRACWLRTEEGSSSGVRNSTRPRWLKR